MLHFRSLKAITAASVEELAAVDGMNSTAAQAVYDFFRLELPEKKEVLR